MNSIERLNEIKNKIIELEGVLDMKVLNINTNKSVLKDKTVCIMGDSYFARCNFFGELQTQFGVSSKVVGKLKSISSYTLYGNGWSVRDTVVQVGGGGLDTSGDCCLIQLGINDSHYYALGREEYQELGNLDSEPGSDTFYGQLKQLLNYVISGYKGKPILYSIQPQRCDSAMVAKGALDRQRDIATAIHQLCDLNGIRVLDFFNEYTASLVLGDGVHPDATSGKRMVKLIGTELEKMFTE